MVTVRQQLEKYIHRDCWTWGGAVNQFGYGQVTIAGETKLVHRVMYEMEVGPIPDGYEIDHVCRVRCCVQPDHLEAVSQQENKRRRMKWGRVSREAHSLLEEYGPMTVAEIADGIGATESTVYRTMHREKGQNFITIVNPAKKRRGRPETLWAASYLSPDNKTIVN